MFILIIFLGGSLEPFEPFDFDFDIIMPLEPLLDFDETGAKNASSTKKASSTKSPAPFCRPAVTACRVRVGTLVGEILGISDGGNETDGAPVVGDTVGPPVVGWFEGARVGDVVGDLVGAVVGDTVGALVGEVVGDLVGALVGDTVGLLVGDMVGVLVGVSVVGTPVGDCDGDIVGPLVGDTEGTSVGANDTDGALDIVGDEEGAPEGEGVGFGVCSTRHEERHETVSADQRNRS